MQFPYSFHRTIQNRQYLAKLVNWFTGIPLAIEFRHASWHIQQVLQSFHQRNLIWCSVDYPPVQGLPSSQLLFTNRIGYLRLHGHNLHWWQATTAKERHDYCYQLEQMQALASQIDNYRQHFEVLYIFFENTTKGYAVTNITMLRQALLERRLLVR